MMHQDYKEDNRKKYPSLFKNTFRDVLNRRTNNDKLNYSMLPSLKNKKDPEYHTDLHRQVFLPTTLKLTSTHKNHKNVVRHILSAGFQNFNEKNSVRYNKIKIDLRSLRPRNVRDYDNLMLISGLEPVPLSLRGNSNLRGTSKDNSENERPTDFMNQIIRLKKVDEGPNYNFELDQSEDARYTLREIEDASYLETDSPSPSYAPRYAK